MSEWLVFQFLNDNMNTAYTCAEIEKRCKTSRIQYKVRQLAQTKNIKSIKGMIDKKIRNVRETWYYTGEPVTMIPEPKVIFK